MPCVAWGEGLASFGYVGVGLPAPTRTLGYDTRGEATASSPPRVPVHVDAELGVAGLARGYLRVGLNTSVSAILGRRAADQSSARWLVVAGSASAVVRPSNRVEVSAGPAAGVLSFALIVDEYLRLDTASLGGGVTGGIQWFASDRIGMGTRISSWWFGPPLIRTRWFNEELGESYLISWSLGIAWNGGRE